jgi:ABC-type antimicrobial peptide transport system permease subunit
VPRDARLVQPASDAPALPIQSLLLTPGSARELGVSTDAVTALADLRSGDAGAADRLRDRAAEIDPLADVRSLSVSSTDHTLASLRHAVAAGAVVVLLMIGASLLVAGGAQLRERRRVLAVLSAVGTPRSTMAWSILWQAAIPVVGGLALAVVLGAALGTVLVAIVHLGPSYDWGAIALMTAAGAAVIAAVTLLTLPMLWRMMRPEALRVE